MAQDGGARRTATTRPASQGNTGPRARSRRLARGLALGLLLVASSSLTVGDPAPAAAASPSGWTWPLDGPRQVVRPFSPGPTRYSAGHYGADLGGRAGRQVHAAGGGRVSYAGLLAGRGVVVVDHGELRTTYEPLAVQVRLGQLVGSGQVLGLLETGHPCPSTCLHLGLRRGEAYLDPMSLFGGPVRLLPAQGPPSGMRVGQPPPGAVGPRGSGAVVGPPSSAVPRDPLARDSLARDSLALAPSPSGREPSELGLSVRGTSVRQPSSTDAARRGFATGSAAARLTRGVPAAGLALLALVAGLVLVRGPAPRRPAGGAAVTVPDSAGEALDPDPESRALPEEVVLLDLERRRRRTG
ncbi:MAG: Peptidase [Frankiales bacterium]|nr:Peptidase [Frankiales bacterium]